MTYSIRLTALSVLGLLAACSSSDAGVSPGEPIPNSGGAQSGGAQSTSGGAIGSGGAQTTGGTPSSVGASIVGGASVGGSVAATGGVSAGGAVAATGGSSAGGAVAATGGATTTGECPVELVGWATTTTGTTGGGNATPVVVTTFAALKEALGSSDPRVVHLSGTVDTGGAFLEIKSNKTLIGVDAKAKIIGGISIKSSNNIIVRNLTVEGKNSGGSPVDAMQTSGGAHHVWFDHLSVINGPDGKIDLTHGSDLFTISWCKFWYTDKNHPHRLALLLGNGSEQCEVDGKKQNHTIHHNWFAELVDQRMPRLLFGKGHIFNNYYNSPGNGYCIGSGSWSSLLVENNYFKGVNSPHKFQDGHPSYIEAKGNVYDQTSGNKDTGRGGSDGPSTDCERGLGEPGPWTPPYAYKADPAESIPALVQKCAGPQ